MAWWPSGGFDDRWAHAVLWASALHRDLAGAALLREGPTGAGRRGTPPRATPLYKLKVSGYAFPLGWT